jgi:hypothetical protein
MQDRRTKILLGVLVVLAAAFLGQRVVGGGGGGGGTPSAAVPQLTTPTTAHGGTPAAVPTESFDVYATRDPFEPVIQAPPPTTVPPTTVPGGIVTDPVTGAPVTTAPPSGSLPLTESAPAQHVSVLDVFVDQDAVTRARVQVGLTQYTVQTGQTFGTSFRVVSLDEPSGCGQFLYGDAPFQLCEGESATK